MVYQFEGRTEKEAIDKAAEELGLEKDRFDVEIVESQKGGLFKKGYVKIEVHTSDGDAPSPSSEPVVRETRPESGRMNRARPEKLVPPESDFEVAMLAFLDCIITRLCFQGKSGILFREPKKLGIKLESPDSSILIGKKGKTLDAIQTVASIYAGRLGQPGTRIVVDSENYRTRREESLVRLAYQVADKVRGSRGSMLLEPMNPFERRIIHSALNDVPDVVTKSEGDGLYKQVRVFYNGDK
jgi:spoIIIJ-associated protein